MDNKLTQLSVALSKKTDNIHFLKPIFNQSHFNAYGPLDSKYEAIGDRVFQSSALKIFAAVLLYIWRQRGKELNELKESVITLREKLCQSKYQLEYCHSQLRAEENKNHELKCQLNNILNMLHETQMSCKGLSDTIFSLKTDKRLLEQELKMKYEDYNALHTILIDTRKDLVQSILEQHSHLLAISQKQRSFEILENHANQLRQQMADLSRKHAETKLQLTDMIHMANTSGAESKRKHLGNSQVCQTTDSIYDRRTFWQKHINIGRSWQKHLSALWTQWGKFQYVAVQYAHIFTFYLLPAIPPPPGKCLGI
ncbi:uncharacterized protein LOC131806602 [Musca domestica]|uniref:Uncharacterized protein LOC131806602 n=1 Tax=Musca domestica TaxID=7370 RepID=A0ABM3VMA2_MUSDO|nr:uncharacterized protein LOC131806602 [Musca domestica]